MNARLGNVLYVQGQQITWLLLEGITHVFKSLVSLPGFSRKPRCARTVCSWWLVFTVASLAPDAASDSKTKWLTSGPVTIHLVRADGSSVTPIAPPSPFLNSIGLFKSLVYCHRWKVSTGLLYHKISTLKLVSHLWMVFLEGQHISQMNGKPTTCVVEMVVGEEVWNKSRKAS